MAIPDYQALMLPLLKLSNNKGEIKNSEAIKHICEEFKLTEEERNELLPSGRVKKIVNRINWAISYLNKSPLLERPQRGHFAITPKGKEVLSENPSQIDSDFLMKYDSFKEFLTPTRRQKIKENKLNEKPSEKFSNETPEERAEIAFDDMNTALREELLEQILVMDPTDFEKLIVDLMLGMGYGAKGSGKHLGQTNDHGIDGIINEDTLGLDIIYLQAKRWKIENSVGRERIQSFVGALDEHGATKGVFVTTSEFTKNAIEYAEKIQKRLILIDGEKLTSLLIEHNVAVRNYRILELKKIDIGYFEDNEA